MKAYSRIILSVLFIFCSGMFHSSADSLAASAPNNWLGDFFPYQVSALKIGPISTSATTVPLYSKFELTFNISNSAATQPQFPYDANPPAGLPGRTGITVNGLFLPPGESNWNKALVQPVFLYQPYLYQNRGGYDWIYPQGQTTWMVRFAAQVPGNWRYKIQAQDASICTQGQINCQQWVQSSEGSFTVLADARGNPGFIKVSRQDPRYFEFSNGQTFTGVGHATDFESLVDAQTKLAQFGRYKANFFRVWMSASLIFGRGYFLQQWDPWANDWPTTTAVAPGSDFSVRLDTGNPCIFFWQGDAWPAFEAGKTYKVRVKAKLEGVTGPQQAGQPFGLAVTFNNWWGDLCQRENITFYLTQNGNGQPITDSGTQDWHWFEGQFTNSGPRFVAGEQGNLTVGLFNTSGGTAYLDEVYIGEDLGGGRIGPNIIGKGKFNYHTYFDQEASWLWDQILETAAAQKVYLKLVIMDKNDGVFNQIMLNGVYDADIDDFGGNENFHAQPNTRVRRLHEYFWRYLVARWGYSTAIHSWELLNEGNPDCNGPHLRQAQTLTDFMRTHDPQKHLTTTSFWAGHTACYYGRQAAFSPDYGDFHAYTTVDGQGTGWLNVNARDEVAWHVAYSGAVRADTAIPMVWAEKGIAQTANPDEGEDPRVGQDKEGIWLHNQTWAWLEPGALYTLYWYNDSLITNNLYPVYQAFQNFMADLPLSNGHYVDIAAKTSNPKLRVLGQKDNRGIAAHFWVQHKDHTWWNVVQKANIAPQSGRITLSGLAPGSFTLEKWDTYRGVIEATTQVEVDHTGQFTLQVNSLRTDTAYKLYNDGVVSNPDSSGLYLPLILKQSMIQPAKHSLAKRSIF